MIASGLRVSLVAVLLLACGCTSTITPPPASSDSVPVFVTNYGRHSSLLLPDPAGHFNEYAFGDWDWFALADLSTTSAIRAMLFSNSATLGRRQLMFENDIDAAQRATNAATILRFSVPRAKAESLIRQLDRRFDSRIDTITYSPRSSMWFVRDDEHYWILHNCNQITARWVQQLGARVSGLSLFSKFTLRPPAAAKLEKARS